jgi:hypothetical protein
MMLKKIVIAVVAGSLLSPVGFALSKTGGKGLVRGGSTYCTHKARAAGGSHPICTSTSHSTVTKYTTKHVPVTTTKTTNRTTTVYKHITYTATTTVGSTTYVTTTVLDQPVTTPTITSTVTEKGSTTSIPGSTSTVTSTDTATTTTTTTLDGGTLIYTTTCNLGGPVDPCDT